MGAWGVHAFENDDAGDFFYELEETGDLAPVENTFASIEENPDYLEAPDACIAIAGCEVLARLKGLPGYQDASTETVDEWIAAHPITPPQPLVDRGIAILDRVVGDNSELKELWDDSEEAEQWHASIADLRQRLATST